ncbi:Bug family tripartite tricarboxylate transporter substrate binding protein [Hydrogenophaga sp.]|jgi:tripartite-type tricarboxylate transporter receptor subunit TctC|uniref:Bug family tripartite tricarboxylate transporter substrate binding protein n=1 Tax=Hydrogenophaga sp. TaxID=1904254 RepID=UPI00391AE4BD
MKKPNRRSVVLGLSAALCSFGATPTFADTGYPNRTIRLVVPFAPGGGGDVIGRFYAQKLSDSLRVPVIVDNRPGASAMIGTDLVAKAQPDGYTLLLTVPLLVQTPHLYRKIPYDPFNDLVPVAELNTSPLWFATSTTRNDATSLKEFVAKAKAKPNDFNFASIGMGSSGHLLGQALNDANQLNMMHVAYKGSSPATLALMAGEVSAVFLDYVTFKPQIASGKIRLLAVTGTQRSELTPEVPTLTELGYKGFEGRVWGGIFAPAKTPKEVVSLLERETRKILAMPETIAKWRELGYDTGNKTQAQFAEEIRKDSARWGALIKSAGVTLD